MFKYILIFKKTGLLRFTSHLDMLRLFKRAFKKARVSLAYSQGFNPHPKLGFAHPLSLGYYSNQEILEFETTKAIDTAGLYNELKDKMALGLEIERIEAFNHQVKSLASKVVSGVFTISLPIKEDLSPLIDSYMKQDSIIALKKGKKDKAPREIDIKPWILDLKAVGEGSISATLAQGSNGNLSPELLISTLISFGNLQVDRFEIEITRESLGFELDFEI